LADLCWHDRGKRNISLLETPFDNQVVVGVANAALPAAVAGK